MVSKASILPVNLYHFNSSSLQSKNKLEQLELLRSEDIPRRLHPYYWFIMDPKSKEDKIKVTNLKNMPKFHIF